MENNEAPAAAPAESVATPNTNDNAEAPKAPEMPDMHGFTSDQLADMRKFFDNNGGFDNVKSRISNPEPKVEQNVLNTPAPKVEEPKVEQPQQPLQNQTYHAPGSITQSEFMARQYFDFLARQEKYAPIAKEISDGDILKEMASFNIHPMDENGNLNDAMVRRYLDLKVQTVPAKQTSTAPEASAAPTVEYVPVGDNISDINQAYEVIRQDAALKSRGMAGHPSIAKAEEFVKNALSKGKK